MAKLLTRILCLILATCLALHACEMPIPIHVPGSIPTFNTEAFSLRATAQQNIRLGSTTPKLGPLVGRSRLGRGGMIPLLQVALYERVGGFAGYVVLPALVESALLVAGADGLINWVFDFSSNLSLAHWTRLVILQMLWHLAHCVGIDPEDWADAVSTVKLSISGLSLLVLAEIWRIYPTIDSPWFSVVAPLVVIHAMVHLFMAGEYGLMSRNVLRDLQKEAQRKNYVENESVKRDVLSVRAALNGRRVGGRVWFDNGNLLWFGLPDERGNLRMVMDNENYVLQIDSGRLVDDQGHPVPSEILRVEPRDRRELQFTSEGETVLLDPYDLSRFPDELVEPMTFSVLESDDFTLRMGLRVGDEVLRLTGDVPVYALAAREMFLARFGRNPKGEKSLTAAWVYFQDLLAPDGDLVDLVGMGIGSAAFRGLVKASPPDVIRLKNIVHRETVQAVLDGVAHQADLDALLPETVVGKLVARLGYRAIRVDWEDYVHRGILTLEARLKHPSKEYTTTQKMAA